MSLPAGSRALIVWMENSNEVLDTSVGRLIGEQSPLEARFGTGGILHTIENRAMLDSKMSIDQIHYEAARQSRPAFGIGLSTASLSSDSNSRRLRQKSEPVALCEMFVWLAKLGKARDCYSRHAQVRILPGQPDF